MPSEDAMFSSVKKVFAHYFNPFPISIDNVETSNDYYNRNYLSKLGESGKWAREGGYLRARPFGTATSASLNWRQLNMESEVRAAISRGITGFTFDVMSESEASDADGALPLMLAAAFAVDPRFKIMVMPDLTTLGSNSKAVADIITSASKSPAAYRLDDGRLVVSAFDAGINSATWWESVISSLSAKGIKVAFVPTFLGWQKYADSFAPISYGFSDWGSGYPGTPNTPETRSELIHKYGKISMAPVDPQQFRPKDFFFVEAKNSDAFRNQWSNTIQGSADWIQLVTWNDYSESSQVAPVTDSTLRRDIGTGYYNLNGYFASWFLTGEEPQITHDVLYYFYRREPTGAAAPDQSKKDVVSGADVANEIELLAFLTSPGDIKITIRGQTYTRSAPAGITSFKVPLQPGTPLFTLSRSGSDIFSFEGAIQIYGASGLPSGVDDLTYWSGSASATGICGL